MIFPCYSNFRIPNNHGRGKSFRSYLLPNHLTKTQIKVRVCPAESFPGPVIYRKHGYGLSERTVLLPILSEN